MGGIMRGLGPGAGYLGMADPWNNNQIGGGLVGSVRHDSGGTVTSAGATTAGLGSDTTTGGFDLHDLFDATSMLGLGPNQSFVVGAFMHYNRRQTNYASNTGTNTTDDVTLLLGAGYRLGRTYATGLVGGDIGSGHLTTNASGGSGKYSIGGFHSDIVLGHVYALVDPEAAGYALSLDVSGHAGYRQGKADGFTDSAGTLFGEEDFHTGVLGAEVKLTGTVPKGDWLVSPYIGATLDDYVGLQHTIAATTTTAAATLSESKVFLGGEAGVDFSRADKTDVALSGFYRQSADVRGGGAVVSLNKKF